MSCPPRGDKNKIASLRPVTIGESAPKMRWRDERRSDNIEDRRRAVPAGVAVGGGVGTLVLVLVAMLLGADPRQVLNLLQANPRAAPPGAGPGAQARPANPAEEERKDFVAAILGDTEDVWNDVFRKMGKRYEEPKLVLFTGHVDSACGFASAAVGPFYCPGDHKVYIDLAFYDELKNRFHAPGEFAQAYVVAHEIGHHVQNLLGISERVQRRQQAAGDKEAKQLSVRLELQADFLAGVWANHAQKARKLLDSTDIEDGLRAASAIGDDRIQMESQGRVIPDSFTHGTSAQRVRWFRRGFETGDVNQGDTFRAEEL